MRVAGLVLAAGEGRRFGGPKAPVVIDDERLIDRSVRCLQDGGCDPVVAVLGAWVGDVPGCEVVVNDRWSEGMGTSLRAGLDYLTELPDVDAVVVTLVDLPGMTPMAVRRLVDADAPLALGVFSGEPGHPVKLGRPHWEAIRQSAQGDSGARAYLRGRSDVALVEVGDVARGDDLDVPEK